MTIQLKIDKVHAEQVLEQLCIQWEGGELCDVVLIAGIEEKRIPAHRCVISAASKYFSGMFMSMMYESRLKEVKMPSVNGDILQNLVKYCYTGCVAIDEHYAVELLKTADMLLMPNVVTACANFLAEQLHPSNCLGFVNLAEQHHCETLLQKSQDYSLRNFMQVRATEEFLGLNVEQLSQLLASDELFASAEEDVFSSLTAWLNHDRAEREKYQTELLKLVRLSLLDEEFLVEHVRPFCTSRECLQIYTDAVEEPNEATLAKPRKSKQLIFSLEVNLARDKMYINYYCQEERKWMKSLTNWKFRDNYGLTVMEDDVYLVGGINERDAVTNTVVCLNLKTLSSKDVNPMKEMRQFCGAAVINRNLYAVGSWCSYASLSSVEKWNSRTNAWSEVAPMAVSRCNFGIATLNNRLYVVGGVHYQGQSMSELQSVECYDPLQNIWTTCAPMHEARVQPGVAVANGQLFVVGGKYNVKTFERYDPATNRWTLLCSLREKLDFSHSCISFHDKVIVYYNSRVEEYSNETEVWKINADLKATRDIGVRRMFGCLVNSKDVFNKDMYEYSSSHGVPSYCVLNSFRHFHPF